MHTNLSVLRLLIVALSFCTFSFGEEYIVRSENPDRLPGVIKRYLGDDLYLVELDGSLLKGLLSLQGLYIEKNYTLRVLRVPDDPCIKDKWELDFIRAYDAWDITTGSENVYVAVLDTGVDYNNPDLQANLWKNPGEVCYDGIDNDANGYVDDCYGINVFCYRYDSSGKRIYDKNLPGCNAPDALDDMGHGTFVAGLLGAVGNNTTLITGVNWNVKIVPCKFLDSQGSGDIAGELECINYILSLVKDKNIKIVALNASYGEIYPDSQIQKDAIASLGTEGIMYVTAAGNSGLNNELESMNPCNYDLDNMLCVGSVDMDGKRSDFSNYGYFKVKLSAPGRDLISLTNGSTSTSCDSLASGSGTSFSTPLVSGAVTLFKSLNPNINTRELRKRLLTSGKNNPRLSGQTYSCNILDLYALLNGDPYTPKVCFSSLYVSFGDVSTCDTLRRELYVRNTGEKPVQVIDIYIEGRGFSLEEDRCSGKTLNSLEECRIRVAFYPPSEGNQVGYIQVRFSDSTLNYKIELRANSLIVCASGSGCSSSPHGGIAYVLPLLLLLRRFLRG